MKISQAELIEDLKAKTLTIISIAENLKELSEETSNWKLTPQTWSVLECLQHLNLYGDFYIPECRQKMEVNHTQPEDFFKSGWLGNYFAKAMLPREKINKMNSPKDKNPGNSILPSGILEKFLTQQHEILQLLDTAKNKNLTKIKTSITLTEFIKLRLGDTLRVVIYHNQRHFEQIDRILASFKSYQLLA